MLKRAEARAPKAAICTFSEHLIRKSLQTRQGLCNFNQFSESWTDFGRVKPKFAG
jgi:hypothetical protein